MKGNNCLKFFTLTWIKRPLELQKTVETNLSSTVRNFLPKLDADESVEDCAWNEYRNTHNFWARASFARCILGRHQTQTLEEGGKGKQTWIKALVTVSEASWLGFRLKLNYS